MPGSGRIHDEPMASRKGSPNKLKVTTAEGVELQKLLRKLGMDESALETPSRPGAWQVGAHVTEEERDWLKDQSALTGLPISRIALLALRRYISEMGGPAPYTTGLDFETRVQNLFEAYEVADSAVQRGEISHGFHALIQELPEDEQEVLYQKFLDLVSKVTKGRKEEKRAAGKGRASRKSGG